MHYLDDRNRFLKCLQLCRSCVCFSLFHLEVESSQSPFCDSSPSPVSLPLHERRSTCSLSSLASFSSLHPFRQHGALAAAVTPVDAGSCTGSMLPLAAGDGDVAAEFRRPNSNGFLYRGLDDVKRKSDSSW